MLLSPVKKRKLELCHACAHLRIILAFAHLLSHVFAYSRDTGIVCMCLVSYKQVKFGVLFNFNAELIQSLDGSVAGEEVLRTRSESNNLKVLNTDDGASDRNEIADHLRDVISGTYRIFRNIALEVAHSEVIRAVQHAAVSIAAAVDHIAVTLGSCYEHNRAVKVLRDQGLGSLGTEVSEEYYECVALCLVNIIYGLEHIKLVLNRYGTLIEVTLVSSLDSSATLLGKNDRETVTAYGNNTEFYNRNIAFRHCVYHTFHYSFWASPMQISLYLFRAYMSTRGV